MTQRREVENDEFFGFAHRIIRAAGKRVGEGDPVDLAGLVAVRKELEKIEIAAVGMMREKYGYSWSEIGRETGVTRQAAQQFYGRRLTSEGA